MIVFVAIVYTLIFLLFGGVVLWLAVIIRGEIEIRKMRRASRSRSGAPEPTSAGGAGRTVTGQGEITRPPDRYVEIRSSGGRYAILDTQEWERTLLGTNGSRRAMIGQLETGTRRERLVWRALDAADMERYGWRYPDGRPVDRVRDRSVRPDDGAGLTTHEDGSAVVKGIKFSRRRDPPGKHSFLLGGD